MLAYDIKCIYCGFTNVYVVRHFRNSMGLKLREMILAPFRKQNSFNHFRKTVKFITDWIDSLLSTCQALYNIFYTGFIYTS